MTPPEPHPLPVSCAVAFKEWAGVCRALLDGRQSLILRKGGIDEALGGFRPEYGAFWLYPTRVHQAQQGLKPSVAGGVEDDSDSSAGVVEILGLAVVEQIGRVDRPERLARLESLHVWTADTVEKRFHYRTPGLYVLGVRVYRRPLAWRVNVTPEHAGCKTWVPLGEGLDTIGLTPALDVATHEDMMKTLKAALVAGEG